METALKTLPTVPGGLTVTQEVSTEYVQPLCHFRFYYSAVDIGDNYWYCPVTSPTEYRLLLPKVALSKVCSSERKPPRRHLQLWHHRHHHHHHHHHQQHHVPTSLCPVQELPGDSGRYGRRWLISIPADACLEDRAGLCPRVLVSADVSPVASEFQTTPAASATDDDVFRSELVSQGSSLSGTDAEVTSSRWIEGWRGYEQQVVSVAATSGSLSGTFRLRYGDQATVPLDVNASALAVEVSFAADWV